MSQFSEQSIKRIAASVDYTEGIRRNGGSYPPPIADESRDLCWVELQYDLNNTGCPEVTSTTSTTAYPILWSVSGDAWVVDTSITVTVRDTLDIFSAFAGDWILTRPTAQAATPYDIVEVVWVPTKIRGVLTADLYSCGNACATRKASKTLDNVENSGSLFTVYDPLGKVFWSSAAEVDEDNNSYIPIGTCFTADWFFDSQQWEVDGDFGACDCPDNSGSDSIGSDSSGSSDSGSSPGPCSGNPKSKPDGINCPGWVSFLACDGVTVKWYWGI